MRDIKRIPEDLRTCFFNVPLVTEAADAIEELLAAVPKWVSVEDGLPKTRKSILGDKSNKVIVAFYYDDGKRGTDVAHTLNGNWVFEDMIYVINRTVTHWMPLPSTEVE